MITDTLLIMGRLSMYFNLLGEFVDIIVTHLNVHNMATQLMARPPGSLSLAVVEGWGKPLTRYQRESQAVSVSYSRETQTCCQSCPSFLGGFDWRYSVRLASPGTGHLLLPGHLNELFHSMCKPIYKQHSSHLKDPPA